MKIRILLATAALVAAIPTVAFAQGQPNLGHYVYGDVPAEQPFGDLDVTPAGDTPEALMTYLSSLTGAQVVDLIRRCGLINRVAVVPVDHYAEVQAEAAADQADAYGADRPAYTPETGVFCDRLQRFILGDVAFGVGARYRQP